MCDAEFKKAIEPLLIYYLDNVVGSAAMDREFKKQISKTLSIERGIHINYIHDMLMHKNECSYKEAELLVAKKMGRSVNMIHSILLGRR